MDLDVISIGGGGGGGWGRKCLIDMHRLWLGADIYELGRDVLGLVPGIHGLELSED